MGLVSGAIMRPNESTLLSQAQMHKPGVSNDHLLQTFELLYAERSQAGFTDHFSPAFRPLT
jgi:hypothetical protein